MKHITAFMMAIAVGLSGCATAVAKDLGNRDVLRLADLQLEKGEYRVAVEVVNDQELAAMDIPLRFGRPGDPITLERVEWSKRVQGWDLMHAAIDNEEKTVILGLISDLLGKRAGENLTVSSTEEDKRVATLVFHIQKDYTPSFATFTTRRPAHALTFIYDRFEADIPHVEEFTPEYSVSLSYKQAVQPREYALSQNYPNPFNPSTSFVLSLPEESDYVVRVYNVTGQLVKTFEGDSEAGEITITWDGLNDQGSAVASGVYFYRAEAKSFSQTRKMMMLK